MNLARIKIGSSDYTYEVVEGFGKPPADISLGSVSNIALDSKNRIYFYQRKNPPIIVFDETGEYITSWGEDLLIDAHGLFITPDDAIYAIARGAQELLKFNIEGECTLRIGTRDKPNYQKPFGHPADIAVSKTNEIFVADGYGNTRVHKFSPKGELLLSWGSPGDGAGEFTTPHGVWVDEKDLVYVTDRENNRVQIFNTEGEYIKEWRNFYHPMDIYVDPQKVFYITDQVPRLHILKSSGEVISSSYCPGICHSVWANDKGDLYIARLDKGVTKLILQ
jgi:peptidylglycine monooxygenase